MNNGPSALVSYYEYDESGQVITDYDIQNERVTKYLYDSGGNITSKKIYEGDDILNFDYNTNSLTLASTPTSTINYGYGYSGSDNTQNNLDGFTDLLTSYNGKNVSYDEIGNPLKYYYDTSSSETKELNLEWQGTLLKTATTADGKEKYVYSYNQEGLRTKKEVYSLSDDGSWKMLTAIDYFWQDGMISAFNLTFDLDDNGPQTMSLKMLYDEYNSPIGISINTTADIDEEPVTDENGSTVYAEIVTNQNGEAVIDKNKNYVTKENTTIFNNTEKDTSITETKKSDTADNEVTFNHTDESTTQKPTTNITNTTESTTQKETTTQSVTDKDGWINKWY